jgi:hypothetical protein
MDHLLEKYDYLLPPKGSMEPISLFGIECCKGWESLLINIFELITCRYRMALRDLEYAEKNNKDQHQIDSLKLKVEEEKSKLPTICQIKSKFATLRFYADNLTEYNKGVISMAETMSESICEYCGDKGKQTGRGWITTLCEECESENKARKSLTS